MTTSTLSTKNLGTLGSTPAIGLGLMGMSAAYGPADRDESIATIHAALDAGVTLFDTGDFYGMGHNELLLAEALSGRDRDAVDISVKFGAQRGPDGEWLGFDARPAAVKTWLAYSLVRLGTDHVDIYRPARLDPEIPRSRRRSVRSPSWSWPVMSDTSACPRSVPTRFVEPTRCTRSVTCRSSTP